jgi:H+-transporting ATPase
MQKIAGKLSAGEDLKSLSLKKLQAKLGTSPEGFSQSEARSRLVQYGYNEISE